MNLPPDAARAPEGRVVGLAENASSDKLKLRVERLREMFGDAFFQSYFGDAKFHDGAPIKVVVRREAQRAMLKEGHFSKLSRVFGVDVMILLGDTALARLIT